MNQAQRAEAVPMKISAVIPTLREACWIAESVAGARAIADEVLVADGGSEDGTAAIARAAGARVVQARRGRGSQLAAGARAASHSVLLFLHADTRLPAEARGSIESALADPDVLGGNFFLRFAPPSHVGQLFTHVYDLRRRTLGIYYGDSPLFVRREAYDRLGGFPEQPLFEDYAFIRRLERTHRTRYVRDVVAVTSDRRFRRRPVQTLALWAALQALYSLGAPPGLLASWYSAIRARPADAPSRTGPLQPAGSVPTRHSETAR
jgi:rSAM/selenodomain-associated transferase 2